MIQLTSSHCYHTMQLNLILSFIKQEDKPDDEGWERTQTKTPGLSIGKDGEVQIFAKDVDINAKNVVQKLAEIQV